MKVLNHSFLFSRYQTYMKRPLNMLVQSCFLCGMIMLICSTSSIGQKIITLDTGQKIAIMKDGSWKYLKEGETGMTTDSLTTTVQEKTIDQEPHSEPEFNQNSTEVIEPIVADSIEQKTENIFMSEDFQKRKKDLLSRLISYDSGLMKNIAMIENEERENKELIDADTQSDLSNSRIEQREKLLLNKQAKERIFHMILDVNGLDENDDVVKELSNIEQRFSEVIEYVNGAKYIAETTEVEATQSKYTPKEVVEIEIERVEEIPQKDEYAFEIHQTDVRLNPPQQACLSYVEIDTAQGIDRSKFYTDFEYLFGYTHEKMQSYFKDKEFLSCEGQMASFGVYNFLSLKIMIQSKRAQKSYGAIEKGSGMKITFINGEEVYLYNVRSSSGQIEEFTGNTIYEVSYAVSDKDLKKLSKHELDQIGIIWTTGFEPYDIYDVDFLMRHANCLVQEEKDYHAQREN